MGPSRSSPIRSWRRWSRRPRGPSSSTGAQVGFAYPFSASVENQTITPDPTSSATLDDSFLYLVAAKATCILSRGALSKAAGQAIKIRSKDDELDLKEGYKGRLAVSVDACKEYKDLMSRYVIDRRNSLGGTVGYAVVTPVRVYA